MFRSRGAISSRPGWRKWGNFQWLEVNGAHAFMRDEGYRYDPELAALCLNMALALLHRKLAL